MAAKVDSHYQLNQLSDDTKYEIKQMLMHKNGGSGVIDMAELGECLEAFGFTPDDEDTEFLKKHMDDNGDGRLEVDELISNIDVIHFHCYYGKDLMKAFSNIDRDGDGIIRMPEMLKYLTSRKRDPMPAEKARRLLDVLARTFDENFDGKFNYTEFVKIYMSDMLPFRKHLESGGHLSDDENKQDQKSNRTADDEMRRKKTGPSRRRTNHSTSGVTSDATVLSGKTALAHRRTTTSAMTGNDQTPAEAKQVSNVRLLDVYGRPRTAAATKSIKAKTKKKSAKTPSGTKP